MKLHKKSMMNLTIRSLVASLLLMALPMSAQNLDNYRLTPEFKLVRSLAAIEQLYVDTVDADKLVEDAIRAMLEKLDPHSSYSTAKEVKQMMASLNGNFDGVGIQYNIVDDTIVVIQPTAKGPSERAGVLAGDRITYINDTLVAGVKITTDQVISKLRGKKGTEVTMTIVREGLDDSLRFTVKRDKIPVHSINATFMIDEKVGYIRIDNFSATTGDEFKDALDKLLRQGMTSLVLDLQGNGGGYLSAAVDVANHFLETNDLVVYTDGRSMRRQDYKADGRGRFIEGKVVVLIDDYSASASEIVAGALQDHDRAIVVGRRSYGKGLVQRPIDMPDGSMIRLTTSHYYTPSGRCIQKPYEKGKKKDYSNDIEERLKRGELTNADSIHFADSLKYKTLKQGRTVYGGGGIMPDIFVALDTTYNTPYYRKLAARGCVAPTVIKYVISNRAKLLAKYPNIKVFKANYEVPKSLIDDILAQGKKKEITIEEDKESKSADKDSKSAGKKSKSADKESKSTTDKNSKSDKKKLSPKEEYENTLVMLRRQVKALVARDLWDMNEYHHIYIDHDDIVCRGLKEIRGE